MGDSFQNDPKGTLAGLHAGLGGLDEHNRLFALAELSFLHAKQANDRQYFLAAALYAYVFLFPEDRANDPPSFDPRLRQAIDFYNRAVVNALRSQKGDEIDLRSRMLPLPFGKLNLVSEPADYIYGNYQLKNFISVENFRTHGLRNHYRQPGIGAPLLAQMEHLTDRVADPWIAPRAKVPVTVFLRLEEPRRALSDGQVTAKLEIHDVDVVPAVEIAGRSLPLESDPSVALAYQLDDAPIWDFELAGFRRGDLNPIGTQEADNTLFLLRPYRPGRIPIVFVHGTASSPARWAEMANELLSDPLIASRYQLWYFIYNSGNPIAMSSMHLRENLQKAMKDLDPSGQDPELRKMVVIGHSQGGLLTKMTSVSSGSRFWENISRKPFDKADLSPETRDLLRRSLFIEPLPFIQRVIFISTPHRGSYVAENWIGKIGRRLVSLPATMGKTGAELIKLNPGEAARYAFRMPTAVDNMDSNNPFMRTLASLSVAPSVKAHSIIPVKGKGPVETGKDGVVRYASAHIDGVESELVVRSGHSCQSKPETIEEVRRILYLHAGVK